VSGSRIRKIVTASGTRLTQKPSTAIGAARGINLPANCTVHKNVEKALAIKAEKMAKHEETKLIRKGSNSVEDRFHEK
jgi:hypothetical protein